MTSPSADSSASSRSMTVLPCLGAFMLVGVCLCIALSGLIDIEAVLAFNNTTGASLFAATTGLPHNGTNQSVANIVQVPPAENQAQAISSESQAQSASPVSPSQYPPTSSQAQGPPAKIPTEATAAELNKIVGSTIRAQDLGMVYCGKPYRMDKVSQRMVWGPGGFFQLLMRDGSPKITLDLDSWHEYGRSGKTFFKCCGLKNCNERVGKKNKYLNQKYIGECPEQIQWVRKNMFNQCPGCKYFFMDASCALMYTGALKDPERTQGVIVDGSRTRQFCTGGVYDVFGIGTISDLALASGMLVESGRPNAICPKKLGARMINVGCWYTHFHVNSTVMAQRRAAMERWWSTESSQKDPYVLLLGYSNRDLDTLHQGMKQLRAMKDNPKRNIRLLIAARGRKIPLCVGWCHSLGDMSLSTLHDVIDKALAVVIPTFDAPANRGVTAQCEAVTRGKITLITDGHVQMHKGFVFPGVNGYTIPVGRANAWAKAILKLLVLDSSSLLEFHRRAFDIAELWTAEKLAKKVLSVSDDRWGR